MKIRYKVCVILCKNQMGCDNYWQFHLNLVSNERRQSNIHSYFHRVASAAAVFYFYFYFCTRTCVDYILHTTCDAPLS